MNPNVDEKGYYGQYGGAYIPEMLYPNVEEIRKNYLTIIQDVEFQKEFKSLLKDYVGRPTPLYFASRLSEHFSINIYLKREDLCHTGAHKINNTIGQALLAKRLGKKRIIAETGAGQHGVATATVCSLLNLECTIYMGEKDIQRQAPNVARMKMLGAQVIPAMTGTRTLKDATNEAFRSWINAPDAYYLIGSVVGSHPFPDMVARFQSVISEEIKNQLNKLPDHVIACVGGGSNAMGAFYHFIEEEKVKLHGVEAGGLGTHTDKTAATLTLGTTGVFHGSKSVLLQDEYGQIVEPHSISAGLDYPGIGPAHAHMKETGRAIYHPITDQEALEGAKLLSVLEGIIPALESAHAVAYLNKLEVEKDDIVVVNLSGRGDKDMATYMSALKL